jgi:hypothetical protein
MHHDPHIADLKRRLERAQQRADRSESDGEYEANRQVIIWLKSELDALQRRAA